MRRPDLAWFGTDRAIYVEIDEDGGHPDRPTECEMAKATGQCEAAKKLLGEKAFVFLLRLNPDAYDGGFVPLRVRLHELARRINKLMEMDIVGEGYNSDALHIVYLYYHSKARFHIDAALARPDIFSVLVIDNNGRFI